MENKPRVLMVHNYYQIGGGEHTVFENETRLLREYGHFLACYTRNNAEINTNVFKKVLLPFTALFSLKTFRDVRRIIKKERIDLVHCHNTFPLISPSVYYAAWSCGVPVIQTIHNFRFLCPCGVFYRSGHICEECLDNGLVQGLKHGCYRSSRVQTLVVVNMLKLHRMLGTYNKLRYIFLTEFNAEKFRGLLGEKAEKEFVKPNFEYISYPDEPRAHDGSYVFAGRLEQNKGIAFLLDAWKDKTDRDLYIFGDGAMRETAAEYEKKNPHIHLMGFQPQDTVFSYLSRASALLFPGELYEGFGMTIIEAFALGTPVICTDLGNPAAIVRDAGAGVVFPVGDKDAFFEALRQTEENDAVYSANAKRAYREKYTPEANYRQLMQIYKAVLSDEQ